MTRLAVSHAFHSELMEPMLAEFAGVLAGVRFGVPRGADCVECDGSGGVGGVG